MNNKISALSFNQPSFCPTANWSTNGTTFTDQATVGPQPRAIFVNTNNTVYVADEKNNKILVWFNNSINPTKIISGNFSKPSSIFVTNNGDIYIGNGYTNGRVDEWISNTNTFATVMNVNSACFGLFIDLNETIYCSMTNLDQVMKRWLSERVMTSTIVAGRETGGAASNQLDGPHGIFVDVNFNLYVADCYNNRIQLFQSGQSNGITVAGNKSLNSTITLRYPTGIVLDAQKYLFIVDMMNNRIVGSGPNGFRCLVGCNGRGSQSNQLSKPQTLSFDSFGNMFVTDQDNNRIQKYLFIESSCNTTTTVSTTRSPSTHDSIISTFITSPSTTAMETTLVETTSFATTAALSTPIETTTSVISTPMETTTAETSTPIETTTSVLSTSIGKTTAETSAPIGTTTVVSSTPTSIETTTPVSSTSMETTTPVSPTPIEATTSVLSTSIGKTTAETSTLIETTTATVASTPIETTTSVPSTSTSIETTASVSSTSIGTTTAVSLTPIQTTIPVLSTLIRITTAVPSTSIGTTTTTTKVSSLNFVAETCHPNITSPACNMLSAPCNFSQPCLNNGTCQNNMTSRYGYYCLCLSGVSGIRCEINYRPCEPNPCMNDGKCNLLSNETFNCTCIEGWEGSHCQTQTNYCKHDICQNKGVCRPVFKNYTCECLGDNYYSGRHCENSNPRIKIHQMVSKSFAFVAIIALIIVAMFVIIMDILKYCFGIDPVDKDRQLIRQKKQAMKRKPVIQRFVYVNAPPIVSSVEKQILTSTESVV